MPISRNGSMMSQTIGYNTSATNARGQQITRSKSQRKNFIIGVFLIVSYQYECGAVMFPGGTGEPATNTILSLIEMNGDSLAAVSTKGIWKASLSPFSVDALGRTRQEFSLAQNYPNPFNPNTTIHVSVGTSGIASLRVFDLLGREFAVLVNGETNQGVCNKLRCRWA